MEAVARANVSSSCRADNLYMAKFRQVMTYGEVAAGAAGGGGGGVVMVIKRGG